MTELVETILLSEFVQKIVDQIESGKTVENVDITEEFYNENDEKVILKFSTKTVSNEKLYRQREWLNEEYIEKGRSMQSIADEFDITPMAVFKWLKKHGLDTRPAGRFANL